MKKIILLLSIFLALSCNQDSVNDIDVSEFKGTCDFVDALGILADQMFFFVDKYGEERISSEDVPSDVLLEINLLLEKNDEMTDWFIDAGYDLSDLEICPNVEEVKKKMLECKIF